jgi:hypothetical protein
LVRRVLNHIPSLFAAVLVLGCRYAPLAQVTFVTTDSSALRVEVLKDDASGWTCKTRTLLDPLTRIPLPWREQKVGIANHALAIEEALRSVSGAEVLLDMTFIPSIEQRVLWTKNCMTVTGKAARILR